MPRSLRRASVALRRHARLRRDGPRFSVESRLGRGAPPADRPFRLVGVDPLRVLLIGGEYAVGFGAGSRAAALDGAIAYELQRCTGRGVTVENRARDQVRMGELAASLGPSGAYGFDLVVWAPTFSEAARSLRVWRDGLDALIRGVRGTSNAGVVLLGIPPLLGAQPIARVGRWRAAQVGRLLQRVASRHPRTAVVLPPPVRMGELQQVPAAVVYRGAAERAMPAVLEVLAGGGDRRAPSVPDGGSWWAGDLLV